MPVWTWIAVAIVGTLVGFLSGLFGKGGSAVATPLLHMVGVPAIVAVASPLPATIPSTIAGTIAYRGTGALDEQVLAWSLGVGIPATAVGAFLTRWVGGETLVRATDLIIAGLGVRFLLRSGRSTETPTAVGHRRVRLAGIALITGLVSGLLANSGGFLLAPLYLVALRMPIKRAFATSLAVAIALAVPGTLVHAYLGHIDWMLVAVLAVTATPLSYVGGRVALRSDPVRLERVYGAALTVLGVVTLAASR